MRRNFVSKNSMRSANKIRTTKTASRSKMQSKRICKAFEEEAEEILEDVEKVVKEYFPANKVKIALNKLKNRLAKEGVNATFDYTMSRSAIRKTASVEVTEEELEEALNAIIDATVEEFEDLLADTEEYIDETVDVVDDDVVKDEVAEELANCGVACRFSKRKARTRNSSQRIANKYVASKRKSMASRRPNPILSKIR